MVTTPPEQAAFLTGGGAVGALMRGHDWSASPLGDPNDWPQSLRSVVGLMLGSKFPMFVAWGPELGFLYNDAYAEILGGKHPAALGARFEDIWSEIWTDISPLITAALNGEAVYREDLPLVMNRRGYDEQTWFTFSYSPVRNEAGEVAGMFCAVAETTDRVLTEWRLALFVELDERLSEMDDPHRIAQTAAEVIGHRLHVDRVHWAEIDEAAGAFEVQDEWTAPGVNGLVGRHPLNGFGDDLIDAMRDGATIVVADTRADRLASPEAIDAEFDGSVRGVIATPLIRGGVWQAALCLHTLRPRIWREDEREVVRAAGDHVWSAIKRAEAERHLRLMVHELNHRVKNSLATVQAIAAQTLRRGEVPLAVRDSLTERLLALAKAHDVLTNENWSGADLGDLVRLGGEPYRAADGASRITASGPAVELPPKTAIALALAFHELATNAAKYGALSTPAGQVDVSWSTESYPDGRKLHLSWRETGGPAVVKPQSRGFGTRLLEKGLAADINGQVSLAFEPAGLVCRIDALAPPPNAAAPLRLERA